MKKGGLPYVSELALQNVKDLENIVKWNEEMGIKLFRMSSDLFPWMTFYEFEQLPDYDKMIDVYFFQRCRSISRKI